LNTTDTIAAVSSAVGPAARMILRLSGPNSHRIAAELSSIDTFQAASATRCTLTPPGVHAHLYAFTAPHSYTADDLIEFHIPGSPVVARMMLDDLLRRGARHAEPGEFTARAYFNGRLDLTRAEGIAATIAAQSERETRAARQLLAGELARRVSPIMDDLAQSLALTEVGIDFTDEDVTFIAPDQLAARCHAAISAIDALLRDTPRFERLAHEPRIVLVGRPNAGKSTLLNALATRPRAVVSNIPGTTRDALTAHVPLRRGTVQLIDVAGIDEHPTAAQDPIEQQMRAHALRELESADHVALIHDPTTGPPCLPLPRTPDVILHTKSDLAPESPGAALSISALTGANMEILKDRLDALAFGADHAPGHESSPLALNTRHVRALEDARNALTRAIEATHAGPELAALEIRCALDALGAVIGQLSPDDLLGRIFSQFCIGK
jgi:tRNA modification GTPase